SPCYDFARRSGSWSGTAIRTPRLYSITRRITSSTFSFTTTFSWFRSVMIVSGVSSRYWMRSALTTNSFPFSRVTLIIGAIDALLCPCVSSAFNELDWRGLGRDVEDLGPLGARPAILAVRSGDGNAHLQLRQADAPTLQTRPELVHPRQDRRPGRLAFDD